MEISYKFEVFEGPIDLLLHLIEKNELDIREIKVALLFDQFMEYVQSYQEADMENLSEFLLMASRLFHIKSRLLLPPDEDEEDNPLDELTAMLVDYVRYKELAGDLSERFDDNANSRFVRDPEPLGKPKTEFRFYPAAKLVSAYRSVFQNNLRRVPPPVNSFDGVITKTVVSVASKAISLLRRLIKGGKIRFEALIAEQSSKSEKIACFLAILELTKRGRVSLDKIEEDYDVGLIKRGETVWNTQE